MEAPHPLVLACQREDAEIVGDENVAGAKLGDRLDPEQEVLLVVELLTDDRLGRSLRRRDERRLGLDALEQRLAFDIEGDTQAAPRQVTDELAVEAVIDSPRQRPGEDDQLGAARQVVELLGKRHELLGPHHRPPLVDLGVRARRGIDDGSRGARLVLDAGEIVENRLVRKLLDDALPGATAGETRRDDGDAEPLERARDVDALAARQREALAGAMALPAAEVRHGERAVDRRVHGDGDDHESQLQTWCAVRPA